MKKLRFTMSAIERLTPPAEGKDSYGDTATPGMYLAVTRNGAKSFSYVRRIGSRTTRVTIGRFPGVTVDQARKQAAHLAGEIAQGKDPAAQRRKARGETTVGELFALYLDGHAKSHKRTWKEDQAQYDRYLAPWKARKLSEVRRADVAALHARTGRENGHYAANRMLALLSAMFNYAVGLGYGGGNPTKGVKRFKEQSRDRFLRAEGRGQRPDAPVRRIPHRRARDGDGQQHSAAPLRPSRGAAPQRAARAGRIDPRLG